LAGPETTCSAPGAVPTSYEVMRAFSRGAPLGCAPGRGGATVRPEKHPPFPRRVPERTRNRPTHMLGARG